MLANHGPNPVQTSVKFHGNAGGRVAIYRPFEKVQHARLPAKVRVDGERFAVVVEE